MTDETWTTGGSRLLELLKYAVFGTPPTLELPDSPSSRRVSTTDQAAFRGYWEP